MPLSRATERLCTSGGAGEWSECLRVGWYACDSAISAERQEAHSRLGCQQRPDQPINPHSPWTVVLFRHICVLMGSADVLRPGSACAIEQRTLWAVSSSPRSQSRFVPHSAGLQILLYQMPLSAAMLFELGPNPTNPVVIVVWAFALPAMLNCRVHPMLIWT